MQTGCLPEGVESAWQSYRNILKALIGMNQMMMKQELDKDIYAQVKSLCGEGDVLTEQKKFQKAREKYRAALDLLPKPVAIWDAATWIYAAIGDVDFQAGDIKEAYTAFSTAVQCPNGIGNPFIHLRLGEIQFELGNDVLAADELARAYMSGGSKVFLGEPVKYFNLVKQKLKEPPGGWK